MSGENRYKITSVGTTIQAGKIFQANPRKFLDLVKHVSQAESQKIKFIEKILIVIDESGPLDTSSIKSMSKLSWNSVTRTLKLLRMKNIVKVKNLRSENNRKIYSLKRDRTMVYLRFVYDWKYLKMLKDLSKTATHHNRIIKYFPEDLLESEMKVPDKKNKSSFTIIKLNDMSYQDGYNIINDFYLGNYCYNCIHTGWLYKIVIEGDTRFCENCGREQKIDSIMMSKKDPSLESRRIKRWEEEKDYLEFLRKQGL